LRAQIAKLQKDAETLQNAARILVDDQEGNRFEAQHGRRDDVA
jgi:hypothetical protein